MALENTRRVPDWLKQSDLWTALYPNHATEVVGANEAVGANEVTNVCVNIEHLPICELDCGDASQLYIVMGAWCMPWSQVPKTTFIPLWLMEPVQERQSLLTLYGYYAHELNPYSWVVNMCARDDVDMYEAARAYVPDTDLSFDKGTLLMAQAGAVKCLARFIELEGYEGWKYIGSLHAIWACRAGILSTIQWMYDNGCVVNSLHDTDWYHHHIGRDENQLDCIAALMGHIHILRYLRLQEYPFSWNVCTNAVEGRNIDVLRYLCESGCRNPFDQTCISAARLGYIEGLQYLRSNIYVQHAFVFPYLCANAARFGQLECLRYLHESGCPWSCDTCHSALMYDHLDCFQYALQNGCAFLPQSALCYAQGECRAYIKHQRKWSTRSRAYLSRYIPFLVQPSPFHAHLPAPTQV